MYMAHPGQARMHYEAMAYASRIEGASPHELVAILYEELVLSLTLLSHAYNARDSVKANAQFGRSSGIIHALEAGLDLQLGGKLAQTLAGIYQSARKEIMIAREMQDGARIERLARAFSDMSASWNKIAA